MTTAVLNATAAAKTTTPVYATASKSQSNSSGTTTLLKWMVLICTSHDLPRVEKRLRSMNRMYCRLCNVLFSNFKQGVCSVQCAFYDEKLFEIMCTHEEDENTHKSIGFYIFFSLFYIYKTVRCLNQCTMPGHRRCLYFILLLLHFFVATTYQV